MKLWNLHTHSVFSDGKNTIEEMVQAAIDRIFVSSACPITAIPPVMKATA